jgi:hypothetical protein
MVIRKTSNPRLTENEKVIQNIMQQGVSDLLKENPRFTNYQTYIVEHIDKKGVQGKFNEIYETSKQQGMKVQDARKKAYVETTNYVASGNLLDEKGKTLILREGKLERSLFEKIKNPFKRFNGQQYLNDTIETFGNLLDMMKQENYKIPEIEKPLENLYRLGFASPAIALLAESNLIDKKKEKYLMKNLYETIKQNTNEVVTGIEKYIIPQKVVASIIGLIGTFLVFSNLKITGAVIGGDSTITLGLAGSFMIFFGLLLFLRPLKKSFKK